MSRRFVLLLALLLFASFLTVTSNCLVVTKDRRTYATQPRCGQGWHAVRLPNGKWKCKKSKHHKVRDHRKHKKHKKHKKHRKHRRDYRD